MLDIYLFYWLINVSAKGVFFPIPVIFLHTISEYAD